MRRTWIIGCAAIFAVSISTWLTYRWYAKFDREYARLVPGTAKAEVLQRFGKPDLITNCNGYSLAWDEKPLDDKTVRCVEEFVYFRRMGIGAWDIGFDTNGRAVTKGYESSP